MPILATHPLPLDWQHGLTIPALNLPRLCMGIGLVGIAPWLLGVRPSTLAYTHLYRAWCTPLLLHMSLRSAT